MASLLLIQTGLADQCPRSAHGDYDRQFREALDLDRLTVHDATSGPPQPPDPNLSGVVITGSGSMVTDREPWSEALGSWLVDAVREGVPILGVCYGHQLLADALGGKVDWNPGGGHLGCSPLTVLDPSDPVLAGLSTVQFYDHCQQVTQLPPGATTLATTPGVPVAAARFAPHVWGVQFHPEWSPAIFRTVLDAGRETLAETGREPATEPIPDTWPGRPALLNFRRLVSD